MRQDLISLILLEYARTWHYDRLDSWYRKNYNRKYPLSIKLSIGKALHQSMIASEQLLVQNEQDFLARLDQAIVNYQQPISLTGSPLW